MSLATRGEDVEFEKQTTPSIGSHGETSDEGKEAEEQQPELNLRSGLALAASVLAYFTTVGFMNAYGVFQQYYTAHYLPDYSNFQISWLGSFATFTLFAFAAPAGLLADPYGPTIPICIGALLQLLAVFMISLCRKYYQFFLAQGILLGISMACINIPTSTIVPKNFKRHRGLAQDRYGHFNMITISVFTTGIIVFCWTTATSIAGLVVWALAFGFSFGAILSQMMACATALATGESFGATVGIAMGSVSFTALFGTPIPGELVKYGYIALSCFSGSALMVGGVFIAFSRLAQSRTLMAKV